MLKRMICQAIVEFTIKPIDPLLIKSGQATVSGVDMAFVKTYRVDGNPEPFIPGTSLKGLVRSMSEKICRSLRAAPVPVCLPYLDIGKSMGSESGQASCSSRLTATPNAQVRKIWTKQKYTVFYVQPAGCMVRSFSSAAA